MIYFTNSFPVGANARFGDMFSLLHFLFWNVFSLFFSQHASNLLSQFAFKCQHYTNISLLNKYEKPEV